MRLKGLLLDIFWLDCCLLLIKCGAEAIAGLINVYIAHSIAGSYNTARTMTYGQLARLSP